MIVAVDIGNTAVKVAWHPARQQQPTRAEVSLCRFPLRDPNWATQCAGTILRLQRSSLAPEKWTRLLTPVSAEQTASDLVTVDRSELDTATAETPFEIRTASVNRRAEANLRQTLRDTRVEPDGEPSVEPDGEPSGVAWRPISHHDLGLAIRTDAPERVGIDRLLGAWGAIRWYPLPAMIIDAGTTVTADYVDEEGQYWGGAIVPGLQMQAHSLAAGTDLLPRLDWDNVDDDLAGPGDSDPAAPTTVTGRNTVDAIRLGVLSSVIGSILRLADLYDRPPSIVITGGDAPVLFGRLQEQLPVTHHPQLVCQSLLSLPLSSVTAPSPPVKQ